MKISLNINNFLIICLMMIVTVMNLCTANLSYTNNNNLQQSKDYQNHNSRLNNNHHHHQQKQHNINHHRQHNHYEQHYPNSSNRTSINLNSTDTLVKSRRELSNNNNNNNDRLDNSNKNSSLPLRLRRITSNYGGSTTNHHYHQAQNPTQFYNQQPSYSSTVGGGGRDYRRNSDQPSDKSIPSVSNQNDIQQDVETFRYDNGWQIPKNSNPTSSTENPNRDNEDRRHICMQQKTIQIPIKTREVYSRPMYRQITEPCNTNYLCTRFHVYHEPAYRDVITHKQSQQISYDCCKGWEKMSNDSTDCLKPICRMKCKNGGTCTKPDACNCPSGFTGRFCEIDINECKENKPCDQICYNTDGSYYCQCKEGFRLHTDMQSCKKIDTDNRDIAFEARDLENEIDIDNNNDDVSSRVHHIEKILENERVKTHELEKNLQSTYYTVDSLKSRLSTLEHMQQPLKESLLAYGTKTKKLENLINLLMKCRKNPNTTYCS